MKHSEARKLYRFPTLPTPQRKRKDLKVMKPAIQKVQAIAGGLRSWNPPSSRPFFLGILGAI